MGRHCCYFLRFLLARKLRYKKVFTINVEDTCVTCLLYMTIFYYYQFPYKSYDVCILYQPTFFACYFFCVTHFFLLSSGFWKCLWLGAVNIIPFYYVFEITFRCNKLDINIQERKKLFV